MERGWEKETASGRAIRDYKQLHVWSRAMELTTTVYEATRCLPPDEKYGLRSQMQRAAVSVPSNIAEGQGRMSKGEFRQFLGQARGSLYELETQVLLSHRLGLFADEIVMRIAALIDEVGRMLNALIRSLRSS